MMVLDFIVVLILLWIAYIDYKTMIIPDRLNQVLGVCGLVSYVQNPEPAGMERLLGLLVVAVPMYLLCIVIPDAFGGGDIKLTATMGFYLGWKRLLLGTYFGFLIGGLQATYLLLSGKAGKEESAHMAFGPALCIGILIAMRWGPDI